MPQRICFVLMPVLVLSGGAAFSHVGTSRPDPLPGAKPARVEHVRIHGEALEGNLEGDAVDRDAVVILPPGYTSDPVRRYPVDYALQGLGGVRRQDHNVHLHKLNEWG